MSMTADAAMPNLDAFDEEFGHEDTVVVSAPKRNTGFRLSTIVGLALAAGIISALALGWPTTSGTPESKVQSDGVSARYGGEKLDAAISRLAREVETLKTENRELRQAQQQAAETISALQSSQQVAFVGWYSDLGALTYAVPAQLEAAANNRHSATARSKPREARQDDRGPVSLEPPQ
jgi:FtsZ-binding cell division protein ZapB